MTNGYVFPLTIRLICVGGPAHGHSAPVIAWNPNVRVRLRGAIYTRRIIAPLGQPTTG